MHTFIPVCTELMFNKAEVNHPDRSQDKYWVSCHVTRHRTIRASLLDSKKKKQLYINWKHIWEISSCKKCVPDHSVVCTCQLMCNTKEQCEVNAINHDFEVKSFINISSGQQGQMHLHNPKDKWIRFPHHMFFQGLVCPKSHKHRLSALNTGCSV